MATNYTVNYNDDRFKAVEAEKNQALSETKNTYDTMINNSESYYQQQIDASKEWANKQSELQQAQTDFTIEKVEQAKDKAKKDYTKEQKGAYTDYQKATNQYGANAETLATQGLQNAGYSESTRTSMYNTYQNRYMAARESYNQAILNYDNNIKEAQLANSSALAKIAYEALQQQLELSLQGFQYKNTLLLQKLDAVNKVDDRYYQRWQNVQSQINTENALAEQIRQYNETMAFKKSEAAREQANWEKQYALSKAKTYSSGGSGGGTTKSKKQLTNGNNTTKSNQQVTQTKTSTGSVSRGYNKTKAAATTLYLSAPGNKTTAVETYLASARANGTITKTEAEKILKSLKM